MEEEDAKNDRFKGEAMVVGRHSSRFPGEEHCEKSDIIARQDMAFTKKFL